MSASELLTRAQAAGVELILNGDRLRIRAPQRPPDELLEALRANKTELLQLLRPRRHVYTYRLHNGDGGTYISDAANADAARDELLKVYGVRLAVVAAVNGVTGNYTGDAACVDNGSYLQAFAKFVRGTKP